MASGYQHLSHEERVKTATLRKEGLSQQAIVRRPRRNNGGRGCRPLQATSSAPRKLASALWGLIVSKLRLHWSPELIAGWLALKRFPRITFQWIFERIRADRSAGGQVRRQGRKPNWRPKAGEADPGLIPRRSPCSSRSRVWC